MCGTIATQMTWRDPIKLTAANESLPDPPRDIAFHVARAPKTTRRTRRCTPSTGKSRRFDRETAFFAVTNRQLTLKNRLKTFFGQALARMFHEMNAIICLQTFASIKKRI